MNDARLVLALAASLIVHALLLATFAGGRAAARAQPTQLQAELQLLPATSAAPLAQAARQADSATAAPQAALAAADAPAAAPEPSAEPASLMSLTARGSIVYLIREQQQIVGRSVQRWQHDGSIYTLNSQSERADANGVRQRSSTTSHGLVSAFGLLPLEFFDEAAALLRFDRERRTATRDDGSAHDEQAFAVVGDTQDPLSLPYQLGQALLHGRSLDLSAVSGQGVARHDFVALGTEDAAIAGARRHLMHLRARDAAATLEVWISLDRQHLPLRILLRDGRGGEIEQLAQRID